MPALRRAVDRSVRRETVEAVGLMPDRRVARSDKKVERAAMVECLVLDMRGEAIEESSCHLRHHR